MNTYCTFAVASVVLAAASGAIAAPPDTESANTAQNANTPLTREAVIADLIASRQAAPTQMPRDGEWYNVPAPLGGRAHTMRYDNADSAQQPMPMPKPMMDSTTQ
ncbi:hypothetical protein B2J86_09385 [Acidovorax sp. SRB_14]|uniref:DUF4148 domain-containing protein n=1 Tax=Acidovorax sp. SRB_14 TaxID=1962699 RepID=UPI001565DC7C|nr:DUF4148 domain-containing protein [Acidovorax sp. SRB_14]NMM81132.1 hypothetical protein [Acidovorax sp. SRB_14]